jgi:FlaG/FlaF family flagellin (archaellin)
MSRRPDARGAVTVERVAAWLLAVAAMAALAGLVVGPGADYRTATPSVEVEGSYNTATGTVTLTHAGGDELTSRSTTRLAVHVTDADTDATTRLTWATESSLPVSEGVSFTVDDPRVDSNGDGDYLDADRSVGFYLEPGDTVEIVWTGRLIGAPEAQTETLDTVTLGNETG